MIPLEIRDFKVGQRVQLHPGTDLWARGAKYGTVVKIGRKRVYVRMEIAGQPLRLTPYAVLPEHVMEIVEV